jgi:hypothetical protein
LFLCLLHWTTTTTTTMRNSPLVVLATGLLSTSVPALGKRVDFVGRPKTTSSIGRRAFGASALNDESDTSYYTNITLGGIQVEVQIDTGRSVRMPVCGQEMWFSSLC